MYIGSGCDLVEIAHFEERYRQSGERLLERLFFPSEIERCGGCSASLAALFAAKEAFAKALGTGLLAADAPSFKDILIRKSEQNAPYYVWSDKLQRLIPKLIIPQFVPAVREIHYCRGLELRSTSLSLSHEGGMALAFATLNFSTSRAVLVDKEKLKDVEPFRLEEAPEDRCHENEVS